MVVNRHPEHAEDVIKYRRICGMRFEADDLRR